jgi:uncharacterized protein (TIGR02597 family)
MYRPVHIATLVGLLAALPLSLFAGATSVSVATDPVGFVTVTTLSNSDTIFSTPLAQSEAFRGSVGSLTSTTVTAAGTPGFTPSAFVYAAGTQSNTYFLRFRTGAMAGSYFTITANTASTVTLDLAGNVLGAAPGDQFAIIPYWTLGTAFPASSAGTAFQTSTSIFSINTEILFPDQVSQGINLSSAATYFFLNGAWRQFGAPLNVSFNDTVMPPDSYVTIRNTAFTGSISVMGGVPGTPQVAPVNSYPGNQQDNFLALTFPVAVTLNNLGLVGSNASTSPIRPSTSVFNLVDQILVFDNTVPGINKSASATYFYLNNAWRKFGSPLTTDFGGDVLQPGSGLILRRGVDSSGPRSLDWQYTPPSGL